MQRCRPTLPHLLSCPLCLSPSSNACIASRRIRHPANAHLHPREAIAAGPPSSSCLCTRLSYLSVEMCCRCYTTTTSQCVHPRPHLPSLTSLSPPVPLSTSPPFHPPHITPSSLDIPDGSPNILACSNATVHNSIATSSSAITARFDETRLLGNLGIVAQRIVQTWSSLALHHQHQASQVRLAVSALPDVCVIPSTTDRQYYL